MNYQVKITQTISRTITIDAPTPEEALIMVKNKFSDGALGSCKIEKCHAQIIEENNKGTATTQ